MQVQEEWYKSWFDSPYYGVLYQNRDAGEAQFFIDNLLAMLALPKGSKIMDLACGSGRHAIYLNKLGFDVTGVDLSHNKIKEAQAYENDTLHFQVGDMRTLDYHQEFDLVLNLFTSFGYFSGIPEDQEVFHRVRAALKEGGRFVIDYFNTVCVARQIIPYQERDVDGVHFEIRKQIREGFIEKKIRITDRGLIQHFTERVELLELKDFERMLKRDHFNITQLWGDYSGAPYRPESSHRLILHCQRV